MHQPNAILKGGPTFQLTDEDRIRFIADTTIKVKILKGNRYEHFEPTHTTITTDNNQLHVYTWTGYTYVAE
ncbi:DUF5988 family protein [Streptomyces sp. NBC_00199]|uniref:DUF5988 family protein n=1 Tax=Streptomyces sp. NBC_00199 TaxID=2975678 RepID=UPI00224E1647|nr:DUF5988 family protein [Streptomyces sp. NBC_00199]MCX5269374.1 DUF5988 family protein [Streptomyces sp. NBC_00199]